MESVPLFTNKKEGVATFLVLGILFLCSLGFEYYQYKNLVKHPTKTTRAKVLNHYTKVSKNGRNYDVFKLKSHEGYRFYTISWKHKKVMIGQRVSVKFKTNRIDFKEYLKSFFAQSIYLYPLKTTTKSTFQKVKSYVKNQHKTKETQEIFSALFFSSVISKVTRDKIQKLGISHLIAISGFHLGLLSMILFLLLTPLYKFFQDRYAPYRNRTADLSIVIFIALFFYMYLIDFSPSFLRSFVMAVFGFFLFSRHIKIVSFMTLLLSVCFILALFPRLLFSIAFWFSASGVFYIFLFLKYFATLPKAWIFILLNIWVYVAMLPIVHYVFPVFTPLQLLSPPLSMLFTLFYPVELLLHAMAHGGFLDKEIIYLLDLKTHFYEIITPLWFLILYLLLSFLGIFYKRFALMTILFALTIFIV